MLCSSDREVEAKTGLHRTARFRAGVCAAVAAWASVAARAEKNKDAIPTAELPAWVREAAARTAPPSGADFAWLHAEQIVEPLAAGGVRVVHRYAGKVLRQPGLDALRQWSVYYTSEDTVLSLKGFIVLPDGSARRSHPRDDVVDGPAISGISVFEDSRARSVKLRGLVVDAVAAFEDQVVYGLDRGALPMPIGSVDEATAYARFELRVPSGFSFTDVPLRVGEPQVTRHERGFVYTFTDVAPLPREEQRPP